MNTIDKLHLLMTDTSHDAAMVVNDLCIEQGWCTPFNGNIYLLPISSNWQDESICRSRTIALSTGFSMTRSSMSSMSSWNSFVRLLWSFSSPSRSNIAAGSESYSSSSKSMYKNSVSLNNRKNNV